MFNPYKLWEDQDTGNENDSLEIWVQSLALPLVVLYFMLGPTKLAFWLFLICTVELTKLESCGGTCLYAIKLCIKEGF